MVGVRTLAGTGVRVDPVTHLDVRYGFGLQSLDDRGAGNRDVDGTVFVAHGGSWVGQAVAGIGDGARNVGAGGVVEECFGLEEAWLDGVVFTGELPADHDHEGEHARAEDGKDHGVEAEPARQPGHAPSLRS